MRGEIASSHRLAVAAAVFVVAGALMLIKLSAGSAPSTDFAQLWAAARGLLAGQNPYEVVGPGRPFDWPAPLLYPLPAVLIVVPLALLPLELATAGFVAIGMGLFAFVLSRNGWGILLALASMPVLYAMEVAQWSVLLAAAGMLPLMGWLLMAKPTIGIAIFAYKPTRAALIGITAILLISLAVMPTWPIEWWGAIRSGADVSASAVLGVESAVSTEPISGTWPYIPPVARVLGPLLLLAAIKWREPEGRLILAMAFVPQTPLLYEAVPLLLVLRTKVEAMTFVVLSFLVFVVVHLIAPESGTQRRYLASGELMVLLHLYVLWLLFRSRSRGCLPSAIGEGSNDVRGATPRPVSAI